jgi:RNA polymerase sigma factor (sigma-70 family)
MNDRTGRESEKAPTLIVPHLSLVPWASGAPVPHDDEAELTRLALAARAGDAGARDLVYQALTPSINRMVAGCARLTWAADCPRRDGRPWDREDLAQEAYLIFNDLVRAWSGVGPFTPYLFAYFPWRLRNAWRRLRPDRPRGVAIGRHGSELAADASAVADEAAVLLEALADLLPEVERIILLAHIRDGLTLAEIARRLGLRPRQVGRRWLGIKGWLRGESTRPPGLRLLPPPR